MGRQACIAEALDAIEPVDERVFDALASPASSVPGSVVPRLGARSRSQAVARSRELGLLDG